ncbi:hypothetical protein B566_EDAN016482 [Ephemera danica]|nr:hypothetical protein B566_EDAN016482 [Ephemera danica]
MGKVLAKIQLHVDFDPVDCRVAARKMMRSIFTTIMLQRMNYAGYTKYDAGDGRIERKFKLKYSKLFAVLVCVMKKLGFKNFYDNKKAILSIVYKSNPRVPAKSSETQTATPSKSVSEHSSSSALNSKSKPTKQKVVAEHSRSPDLNSKSKTTKQKVVAEHSSSSDLNSKSKPTKQKVVTEHSSSPGQEDLNSKCAEEILFGNFELATLTCSTANIPIESSTSNVVTDDIIEPDTISSIEQDFLL